MSETLTIVPEADSAKRRQIVEGARAIFLTQGFDAASMNDIARKAGVSKGTLYVYFRTRKSCSRPSPSSSASSRPSGSSSSIPPIVMFPLCFLSSAASSCSSCATARLHPAHRDRDRRPDAGSRAAVLRGGPAVGIGRLGTYLRAQVEAGILDIAPQDCEIVAAQFLESCLATTFKPVLFNFAPPPPQERIDHVVCIAVRAFMKAYGKRQ